MKDRKLLMTFPVTATSHTLTDYQARSGYTALRKVLTQMTPQQVTAEVNASGIQGRGGAAFPAGRKWGVINLNDGQPISSVRQCGRGRAGTLKEPGF